MSCFICNRCGDFKDSDFENCEEDPDNNTELICLECYEEIEED